MGDFLEFLEGFPETRDIQDLVKLGLSVQVLNKEKMNKPDSCTAARDRCTQFRMNDSKTV